MIAATRNQRRALAKENLRWPVWLKEVPREQWPFSFGPDQPPLRVLRSHGFLVQIYAAAGDVLRLSANKSSLDAHGRWDDGISWDELQRLKREAGYGDRFAVEIYPKDDDVVNVGNLRHLWILPDDRIPPYAWRRPRP